MRRPSGREPDAKKVKPPFPAVRLLPDSKLAVRVMKDQELDILMRQITSDAALDETAADEIADSSALWWSVQREIRNAGPAKAPWPPKLLQKLFVIGLPVAAVLLIGIGIYLSSVRTGSPDTAKGPDTEVPHTASTLTPAPVATNPSPSDVTQPSVSEVTVKQGDHPTPKAVHAVHRTHAVKLPKTLTANNSIKAAAEIKSDFIALAYARSPESGQLVRVKVPSSMMVQLGLVSSVDKPSQLVDAEVLVGDDGLTHAIRFIRQ